MIIIDRLLEKKEQKIFREELETNGFALKTVDYHGNVLMKSRVFLCLIRGILIFMACFGTAGAAVSAFGLSFNVPLVVSAILFISFFVAFIYYNKLTFYLGYFIFFIVFAVSIFSFYFYVNSGFQAFINTLNQEYSNYFYLNSAREANEIISDRYVTVSVAMIFLSGFLAILLNITISGYMNLPETFLLTFPIVQTGLYIERKPGLIYLIMLLSVYICVAILGRSGHYMTPDISGKRKPFKTIKKTKKNETVHLHSYVSDGLGMITTGIWSFVFCIAFILLTSGIFYANFDARHESNLLKNTTDEYIKSFVQNGIYSFFDRYQSKGGLSRGRLGGVSSVRPDYETDLVVTYAPVNTDNVYLKAYTGTTYTHNLFDTDINTQVYNYDYNIIHTDMFSMPDHNPYARGFLAAMDIENIDADNTYDYMPYYAESSTGRKLNDDGHNFMTVYYEPYEYTTDLIADNVPSDDYRDFVYDTYLDVIVFIHTFIVVDCLTCGFGHHINIFGGDDFGDVYIIKNIILNFRRCHGIVGFNNA